jgi:hypothetical protein
MISTIIKQTLWFVIRLVDNQTYYEYIYTKILLWQQQ